MSWVSVGELARQLCGDDPPSFRDNRGDHLVATGNFVDQALSLASPPQTPFDVAVAINLISPTLPAGEVCDVIECRAWSLRQSGDLFGD